jgi:hypothetical protein
VAIRDVPEAAYEMALNAVHNIAVSGECPSNIANLEVVQTLKVSFSKPLSLNLQQKILEVFEVISETDDGKRMLVEGSVCDTLLDVIMASCKGKSGKEVASVTHGAANLINLVLTGDDSMALMFDEGRGRVITEISIWLTQSDEVLQAAGALVIGNCARTNESCQKLFEIGIVDELLSLIRKLPTNFVEQQNVSKQQVAFAVLSALRNFSIPGLNSF